MSMAGRARSAGNLPAFQGQHGQIARATIRRPVAVALLGILPAAHLFAASAYDQLIAPILRARCVECHGEQKQKAKLALHTWEGLAQGSDGGPVMVAGQPGESVLLQRVRLPVADEDHMPPADRPQPTREEIELLARWIERGASPSVTVAELQLPEPLARVAAGLPAKLDAIVKAQGQADTLWDFKPEEVAKSRAPLAAKVTELQRRFPGALNYESWTSPALHFTAAAFGREFGDAELAALLPLRDELVVLDVSNTGISDAAAPTLAQFRQLRVLRAGFTRLGDATVAQLAGLRRLESLSLHGTAISPASLAVLGKLPALQALRVAGTAAEQPAQAANLPVAPSAADLVPPVERPNKTR